jgi:hypothetical protein
MADIKRRTTDALRGVTFPKSIFVMKKKSPSTRQSDQHSDAQKGLHITSEVGDPASALS